MIFEPKFLFEIPHNTSSGDAVFNQWPFRVGVFRLPFQSCMPLVECLEQLLALII